MCGRFYFTPTEFRRLFGITIYNHDTPSEFRPYGGGSYGKGMKHLLTQLSESQICLRRRASEAENLRLNLPHQSVDPSSPKSRQGWNVYSLSPNPCDLTP